MQQNGHKTSNLAAVVSSTSPHQLEALFSDQYDKIEEWFSASWKETKPPFYGSVDLRNAGFKLAPVDTNLFPAGFNIIGLMETPSFGELIKKTVKRLCPQTDGIIIIPENHTRNMFYFENVASLKKLLEHAGFTVRIGSLLEHLHGSQTIKLPSGRTIILEPLLRKGNRVAVADFSPCLVLINNDFSDGVPPILENIEQKLTPPLRLGWATRLKSVHFQHYQDVSHEFAREFNFDPWLIAPLFRYCGDINFLTREGEDCLIRHTATILKSIAQQYHERGISEKPFVIVKADAGSYGMSVMSIDDSEQIRTLKSKKRGRMSTTKGGQSVTKAIIQEGIYTVERFGKENAVTEPVIYMIGSETIGGAYRIHTGRAPTENLNTPGMRFEPMVFSKKFDFNDPEVKRIYAYGVVSRLALLAAARELQEVEEEAL